MKLADEYLAYFSSFFFVSCPQYAGGTQPTPPTPHLADSTGTNLANQSKIKPLPQPPIKTKEESAPKPNFENDRDVIISVNCTIVPLWRLLLIAGADAISDADADAVVTFNCHSS